MTTPEEVTNAKRKIVEYESEQARISDEFKGLIRENPAEDEAEVLGFAISSPFERNDLADFDEPDPNSELKKMVLCIVRDFKVAGNEQYLYAFLKIETPSRRYYELVMPSKAYEPLSVNSCCILSVVKNRVELVVSNNAWKS